MFFCFKDIVLFFYNKDVFFWVFDVVIIDKSSVLVLFGWGNWYVGMFLLSGESLKFLVLFRILEFLGMEFGGD